MRPVLAHRGTLWLQAALTELCQRLPPYPSGAVPLGLSVGSRVRLLNDAARLLPTASCRRAQLYAQRFRNPDHPAGAVRRGSAVSLLGCRGSMFGPATVLRHEIRARYGPILDCEALGGIWVIDTDPGRTELA
jgi:hypothetical protein